MRDDLWQMSVVDAWPVLMLNGPICYFSSQMHLQLAANGYLALLARIRTSVDSLVLFTFMASSA